VLEGRDPPGDRGKTAARAPQAAGTPRPETTPAAASARVGKTIAHVGDRPTDVEVVNGHAWVVSSNRARITSIDAESGDRRAHQPFVGRGTADIARDGDTVWVAGRGRGGVLGFSARSGKAIRYLETAMPPTRVAAGPSGLWVVGREEPGGPAVLMRYDREGRSPFPLWQREYPAGVSALALGGGYLWVALEREKRVIRIPRDGVPEHGAWLGSPAAALAYGAGHAWASVAQDDSIARINTRSKNAPTTLAGRRPQQLVVADQRVFVASHADHRVVVIDARTLEQIGKPLPVPRNPYGVAAGGGHVWVTGIGTNTLTRIDY
jgi:DNA-binding beta-propeller fold protein YncE